MNEIVERLRYSKERQWPLRNEAADEIEALNSLSDLIMSLVRSRSVAIADAVMKDLSNLHEKM